MLQPYIESATALSDSVHFQVNLKDMLKIQDTMMPIYPETDSIKYDKEVLQHRLIHIYTHRHIKMKMING